MVEYEYAKAIFELAVEEKKTELFLDYFNGIFDVTSSSMEFNKMLSSPLIEAEGKIEIIKNVFKGFDKTFLNFIILLVKNNRFDSLEKIKEEYNALLSDYNSILKVEVISSEKLTKERLNEISGSLKVRYPEKKLRIENTVNPKILYGLQVICNGESIDMSLKTRLAKLKDSL